MEVIVICEGETEERFIKQMIAPSLRDLGIHVKPILPKDKQGGAINFDRLKDRISKTMRQNPYSVISTFLDLYALDTSFPGFQEAQTKNDALHKAECLEKKLHKEIINFTECRQDYFIPHIQPYEFEGLLFSDVEVLCSIEPGWENAKSKLKKILNDFASPEHINGSPETAPSKRLQHNLCPKYRKTRHGPIAAEHITLPVMEQKCKHFKAWMDSLRKLQENDMIS